MGSFPASSFMVGNAPGGASYQAPRVDFSGLGTLLQDYMSGNQARQTLAQQNAYPNGIPRDAQGNPDLKSILDTQARLTGAQGMGSLLGNIFDQQTQQRAWDALNSPNGQPGQPGSSQPQTANPASLTARPIRTPGQGSQAGSLSDIVGSVYDPASPAAGNAITALSRKYRISDNDTPLDSATGQSIMRDLQAQAGPQAGAAPVAPNDRVGQTFQGLDSNPVSDFPGRSAAAVNAATNSPEVQRHITRAQNLEKAAATLMISPRSKEAGVALLEQAKAERALAQNVIGAASKAAEPTTEERNAANPSVQAQALELQRRKDQLASSEKKYSGIHASALQYEQDLKPMLQISKSILHDPRTWTGIGADRTLDFNRVKAIFGNSAPAQLQEALQKVTATSVLSQLNVQRDQLLESGQNSGRIFQKQVELVNQAAPALTNTLAGNRTLVEIQTRAGEVQSALDKMARAYRGSHGGILDDGWDDTASKYIQAHPLITPEEQKNIAKVGAVEFNDPQAAKAAGDAGQISKGEWIRTPQGYRQFQPGQQPAAPRLQQQM